MSNIVQNARTALLLMNQRGLAPTPENYALVYNEVSGIDSSRNPEELNAKEIIEHNRRLMRHLDELASVVTRNAGELAQKLEVQDQAIKKVVAELKKSGDQHNLTAVLQPVLNAMQSVQHTIKTSHTELVNSHQDLHGISNELSQSKEQLLIDPLTGVRNRLNMENTISQERARAKRNATPLTVAMLDIDHLKKINESFGNDAGDKVLAHFAGIAKSLLREEDTLFRHGGEEFLMLLPATDRSGIEIVVQRLREILAQTLPINPHDNTSSLPFTFSAGVAELNEDDDALSLMARAERALGAAKQKGRNCTVTDLQLNAAPAAKPEESSSPFPSAAKPVAKPKAEQPKPKGGVIAKLDEEMLFLGRLPVLYADHALFGYDVSLYASRLGREQPPIELKDMVNYLDKVGIERVSHEHVGFIPVTRDELMGNEIRRLPTSQMALEVLDVSEIDQKALERCLELKDRGFKLCLHDYFDYPVYDALLKIFDFVKLDIHAVSNFEMNNAVERLKEFGHVHRIAKGVDTLGTFERAQELQFNLVQGVFFTHSEAATLGNANPQQTTLLLVLGQLLTDVDLPRIERAFQDQVELTSSLLMMVNSAAMGLSRKVESLQQALVILGRRQLMRWVQVLLYSHSDLRSAEMLMQMAAVRAKLMDLICSTHADAEKRTDIYRDRAFSVGILSLSHVLLGMDLVEVVDKIGLDDEVRQALLDREGFFGKLLSMTEKLEVVDFESVDALLRELDVAPRDLNRAQRETLAWVHNLGKSAD